uniref:hypothetical protein n=1 Tax=Maridesulfovibrio frigidus TaxID=340956 RepID=UPI000AC0CFEF|nr:hypothetical protein [Maridesulfovibrio frigidus]
MPFIELPTPFIEYGMQRFVGRRISEIGRMVLGFNKIAAVKVDLVVSIKGAAHGSS